MNRSEALKRLATKPTGGLATVGPDGNPHLVVVTFAIASSHIVTAVDHKPKTTTRLRRITNLEANHRASFLVDHYEHDWEKLWWVRVDGPASILTGGDLFDRALDALTDRYQQYRERRPMGPVIAIACETVTSWAGTR